MNNMSSFLLMMPPSQGGEGGASSMIPTLVMFAAIILIFYFLMIRPQKKRQQEHQKMLDAITPGTKVITSSGIHGIVDTVSEKTVVIKVDTIKMKLEKAAIVTVGEKE